MATTWATFGRPALEVEARARIEQEGILAAQSLACDFGGFLADTPGRTGTMSVGAQNPYQFTGWNASNSGVLLLNYYVASTPSVITITYQLEGNRARAHQLLDRRLDDGGPVRDRLLGRGGPDQPEPGGDHAHHHLSQLHDDIHAGGGEPLMIVLGPSKPRGGFTMTAVVISLMLLFALWCFVARTTSSLVRIETNRVLQQTRDQGAMNALAQAIQLLQYSKPSDPGNPNRTVFTYDVSVPVQNTSGGCTSTDYTVIYTARPDLGPSRWQVQVSPGSSSVPLPSIGASPQWP